MPLVRSVVLACAVGVLVTACGADEPEVERVAYSAPAPSSPPPVGERTDEKVPLKDEACLAPSAGSLVGPVPKSWQTLTSPDSPCTFADGTSTLTFEYGDVDGDPWEWILSQANTPERLEQFPGFEPIRQTSNAGGGPLWHYQTVDTRVDGSVYVDSLHLFRDGWHVTYEADADDYNAYLERQLIKQLNVIG